MQAGEVRLVDARLAEARSPVALGLARADRADISRPTAERLGDRRLIELRVMRQDRDGVVRSQADRVEGFLRPVVDQPLDVRESLLCREGRPCIDDDPLVAERARDARQGTGNLGGADDDQSRPDRECLHEQRTSAELHRARQPAPQRGTCGGQQLGVERGVAERAVEPVVVEDQGRLGGRAVARRMVTELGRRRIRGQGRDHHGAMAADLGAHARRLERRVRDRRLHEDVDRAPAGEPHVPRLLVADAVANHAGVPRLPRALDLLGRGTLDAAAADRSGDPPVCGGEQDRAFRPRRGAERAHHHRAAGSCRGLAPGVDRREELLHRRLR